MRPIRDSFLWAVAHFQVSVKTGQDHRHIGPLVRERLAWLRLAAALRARGLDIDTEEHRPLAEATRRWGEKLVALRSEPRPCAPSSASTSRRSSPAPRA